MGQSPLFIGTDGTGLIYTAVFAKAPIPLLDYLLSAGAPITCQKRNYLTKRPMLAACMSGSLPLVK
jgi:hypothetical protein